MSYSEAKNVIVSELYQSLSKVNDEEINEFVDMICSSEKVFVVGVGRVLLMLQAFVKRLNHLGIEANFVGAIDEPAITDKDLLIVGSGSGESIIPLEIVKLSKKFKANVVHIGSNAHSSMSEYEDLFIRIPCRTKLNHDDEIISKQPMSSLFEQSLLILTDAVSMMIIEKKDIKDIRTLWKKHANLE